MCRLTLIKSVLRTVSVHTYVWHACNHYERSTTVPSIQGTVGSPGFRGLPGSAGFPVSSLQHALV